MSHPDEENETITFEPDVITVPAPSSGTSITMEPDVIYGRSAAKQAEDLGEEVGQQLIDAIPIPGSDE